MKESPKAWPHGKRFALCPTHDVDRVRKFWWHSAYYLLKTGNSHHLKTLFAKHRETYWNIERIMEIEEKLGIRSTFFFLNESKKLEILRPRTYKLALGNYDISDKRIAEAIRNLDMGGWEVGVHGSYDSYINETLLAKEKKELEEIVGKPIIGIRQHYLNLEVPKTWERQREAKFKYDASFGFNDRIGFRDGKIRPFRPFRDEFLEIPLTIMDAPLFDSSSGAEDAWCKCKELISRAENEEGLLTILWHNYRFDNREYPGQARIYERIVEECKKRKAWIATGGEIWSWCKDDP